MIDLLTKHNHEVSRVESIKYCKTLIVCSDLSKGGNLFEFNKNFLKKF